ncbi:(2Fe-2S)-binding protein [Rhodohalobacter sp. SW132]|uniref:2Fe-2S iron-sulfur cluster-binding protein n=1 Tax=Rhodohalobacter sp. SW132 TaxID=2293433 RepID=UPI000E23B665|nr:2Fe-2S iron-sulfur cluster-binding protein [Rhodohalobacter sp. SW132]REL33685.1 (2Fe-2S)-binding protein [Rhodohalobacter sp. SW132]
MPEVIIDGKRFEYEGEHRLLQFILDQGLEVPFFCYHPSMSAPANCRQCMVKVGQPVKDRETGEYELDDKGDRVIRWFPKLQTSCNIQISDGMVVQTQETDDLVKRAQKDTLEFILANHPLDCPICDQAGECPLQIQTYKYGPEGSRFEVKKVHKPKRVQLGPRVILDAERCINCTRCVRFTNEISKTHQLTITSRGDKNYPVAAPGREFDDAYSLNTVDICPVGALTSADFRFKARVWEMNQTPSIDITNGKGCNIDLWTRDNLVLRITPRQNEEVNDYWMPDIGREAYKIFNENRISRPMQKLENEHVQSSWKNAVETLAEHVEQTDKNDILFIGSPHASVEENYVLMTISDLLAGSTPVFTPHIIDGAGDDFLLTDDQAPNTNGCRLLGLDEQSESELKAAVKKAKLVIMLSDHLIDRGVLETSDFNDTFLAMFATNHGETTKAADLVIPVTTAAEHAASYVNVDKRIQRTVPAKETKYTNRRLDLEMSEGRLDRYGTSFDNWRTEDNKVDCLPLWTISNEITNRLGLDVRFSNGREILSTIADTIPAFSGISYQVIDEHSGIDLNKIEKTVKS